MKLQQHIVELELMKSYPKELSYAGNLALLSSKKISIVGARKTSKYSRELTHKLALALAKRGMVIVSGGAIGVDAVAHSSAGAANTIAILPCGIEIKYPKINKNLLTNIEKEGLLLSPFQDDFKAAPWSFVSRNELVVALGDVLVVAEAELKSGSMRSVEFALKMGKKIFVFPHRLGESSATNKLLQEGKAQAIYDIEEFANSFVSLDKQVSYTDDFLEFCKTTPTYEDALSKFPNRVFEAELSGEIVVKNAKVFLA